MIWMAVEVLLDEARTIVMFPCYTNDVLKRNLIHTDFSMNSSNPEHLACGERYQDHLARPVERNRDWFPGVCTNLFYAGTSWLLPRGNEPLKPQQRSMLNQRKPKVMLFQAMIIVYGFS